MKLLSDFIITCPFYVLSFSKLNFTTLSAHCVSGTELGLGPGEKMNRKLFLFTVEDFLLLKETSLLKYNV